MTTIGRFDIFNEKISRPFYFRFFLLFKLPVAYFSGLQLLILTREHCWVSIHKKWFNKNPFKSIYFASLAMAAEMSTGVLVMGYCYKHNPKISMLVTTVDATYLKKSVGTITFKCADGRHVADAVNSAIKYGVAYKIITFAHGYNEKEEMVASFKIVWSLKTIT